MVGQKSTKRQGLVIYDERQRRMRGPFKKGIGAVKWHCRERKRSEAAVSLGGSVERRYRRQTGGDPGSFLPTSGRKCGR